MKKSLTKLIVSCAAVTAVAAAMAVSASAAAGDVVYDKDTTTIKNELVYAEGNKPSGQATILVQKKTDSALTEGDILYIDQQASDGTVPTTWTSIKVAALADGTYVLKMGGTGVADLNATTKEFTVGEVTPPAGDTIEVLVGDVNMDFKYDADGNLIQTINYKDAVMILDKATGKVVLTTDQETLALVNDDTAINYKDAVCVLEHATNKAPITKKATIAKPVAAE